MTIAANEFERPYRLDTIGEAERAVEIAADEAERRALAARFGWLAIDRLEAQAKLHRAGDIVHVTGRLVADVTQSCIATGDPLPAHVDTSFVLRFVPESQAALADEIELSEQDCDTVTYAGSAIDLGEAVAETLTLALDPFPRGPDADGVLRAAGVIPEEEVEPSGPFAGLKGLLKRS